jgi:acetate kinase
MNETTLLEFLRRQVGLFQDFAEARLGEVVSGSRIVSYEPQEAILEFGEEACFLGVLLEGVAQASIVSDSGDRRILRQFQPGETFGEMAVMTGDKMVADIIAETRCRVLLIPLTLFSSAIMSEPRAARHISQAISDRHRMLAEDPSLTAAAFRHSHDPYGLSLKSERPEIILVVNCGSSSLKYALFDTEDPAHTARGVVERIGTNGMRHVYRGPRGERVRDLPPGGHREAFDAMLQELTAPETGVLRDPGQVSVVGHRLVHGGERFVEAVALNAAIVGEIEALSPLAPLHNPINLVGVREAYRVFPAVPQVAVFDTAFHRTLPSYAYLYGLPYEYYATKGIRRYGFHGSSHAYVCLTAAQHLYRRFNELEIISCHLGNGASICAVDHGRSVDTSMGLTPTEGLLMGTRSGDVDPGILAHLARTEGITGKQFDDLLNKQSGLLGLSGISSDMREVERAAAGGDHRALVALKTFCYRVRKYIGAYVAAMGGLDVIVFTGGIGQGSAGVRSLALQGLRCMGIQLDEERNRDARGFQEVCRISTDASAVTVLVVPTDEERMIARETLRALRREPLARVLETQRQDPILIEVSAHHVHLSQPHVDALFGPGYALTRASDLSQPGQFACQETVTLVGPKGRVERVRVLGPVRPATQVEIAMTEQFQLGIHAPVRDSGDLKDTPGLTLTGPAGTVTLDRGVICALRHIHMSPEDALRFGVRDKSTVRVRVPGDRELIFGDVRVRVNQDFRLAMHLDTDEANAANLRTGATGCFDGLQSQD